jgi:hypothetical protein
VPILTVECRIRCRGWQYKRRPDPYPQWDTDRALK